MRWRLLAVAGLLVLAGCGAVPSGESPDGTATVTPAPVPDTGEGQERLDAGPGFENGTVDGSALQARHADTLDVPYTRIVRLRIEGRTETVLAYRARRTLSEGTAVQRRRLEGPATARFVPDAGNATAASEARYDREGTVTRRQVVDGTAREQVEQPLEAPVLADGGSQLAVLLDYASVDERTRSDSYRVSKGSVPESAVPEPLTGVTNGTVRATIRRVGRITRLSVRYQARLDGRRVTVTQEVTWRRPVDRELG